MAVVSHFCNETTFSKALLWQASNEAMPILLVILIIYTFTYETLQINIFIHTVIY